MAKMGGRRRGRKTWTDLSPSQQQRQSERSAANRFKKEYFKWLDGKRDKIPMFRVDNPTIREFLTRYRERVDKFYYASDDSKQRREDNRRESARKYYEKNAKKVNRGNSYIKRGPQPSRIVREEQERINNKPIDYQSLSDEEKLAAHEEHMIRGDVKKGWRCLLCKKFFDDEGEKNKLEYRGEVNGEQMTVYYHPECNK